MSHILFISHARGAHGAEIVMTQALRACTARGARVTLVVPSLVPDEGLEAMLADIPNLSVLCLPYRAIGGHALRTLWVRAFNSPALRRLIAYVRQEAVDTIYSSTSITILGADLARRTHVRHVWHWHEAVSSLYGWHPSLRPLYRRAVQQAQVLFISRLQQEEWTKALGLAITGTLVYNPIRSFAVQEKEAHKGLRIGFIGRWEKRKNIPMLLHIFARFHRINPQSGLWICGAQDEAERQRWEQTYPQEGVSFMLHTNDVAAFYSRLDLLAMPSISESWGLVAVEAMQAGVAVLCTDQSGLKEYYTDGVDCLFLPPTDEQAWIEALVRYSDEHERKTIALAGQKKTLQLINHSSFDAQITLLLCE